RWAASELPSSEDLDPYPTSDAPMPTLASTRPRLHPGSGRARNPIAWISVILLALIPLGEPVLSRVSRGRRLRCAGLPGVRLRNSELLPMNVILTVDLIVTFVVTVAIAGHVWSWALLLFVLIAIALAATAAVDTLQRVRKSVVVDNELYSSIEAYAPRFILYYGVPTGSEYQVEMWIRYLERIGEPFIV